jgi:hypothetical protein
MLCNNGIQVSLSPRQLGNSEPTLADLLKAVNETRDMIVSMVKALKESVREQVVSKDEIGVDEDEVETVQKASGKVDVFLLPPRSTQFGSGTPTSDMLNCIICFLARNDVYADEWVKIFKNSKFGNPKLHLKWGDIITFDQLLDIGGHQGGLQACDEALSMENLEEIQGMDGCRAEDGETKLK